jgi:hypothetical protein
MLNKEAQDSLNSFAKYVIQQSRSNLTEGGKKASAELYNPFTLQCGWTPKKDKRRYYRQRRVTGTILLPSIFGCKKDETDMRGQIMESMSDTARSRDAHHVASQLMAKK